MPSRHEVHRDRRKGRMKYMGSGKRRGGVVHNRIGDKNTSRGSKDGVVGVEMGAS